MSLSTTVWLYAMIALLPLTAVYPKIVQNKIEPVTENGTKRDNTLLPTLYLRSLDTTQRIFYYFCCHTNKQEEVRGVGVLDIDPQQMDDLSKRCEDIRGLSRIQTLNEHPKKKFLNYPGTLWCGKGNLAKGGNNAYGTYEATDRCCQAHDQCTSPKIDPFQSKYGMYNVAIWTKFQCSTCNLDFRDCLRRAEEEENEDAAYYIGITFFHVLNIGCIDEVHLLVCSYSFLGICIGEWYEDVTQPKTWKILANPYSYI